MLYCLSLHSFLWLPFGLPHCSCPLFECSVCSLLSPLCLSGLKIGKFRCNMDWATFSNGALVRQINRKSFMTGCTGRLTEIQLQKLAKFRFMQSCPECSTDGLSLV